MKAVKKDVFDINKVTVVGSPTITSDGVASGFSSENYITVPFDSTQDFIVEHTFVQGEGYWDGYTIANGIECYHYNYVARLETYWRHSAGATRTGQVEFIKGATYKIIYKRLSSVLNTKIYIDGILSLDNDLDLSTFTDKAYTTLNIGKLNPVGDTAVDNTVSIDLKQLKITQNGVTYSPTKPTYLLERRKEGYDPSKFTIVGSPTITEYGVASGFSGGNYITVPNYLSSKNNFKITGKWTCGAVNETILGLVGQGWGSILRTWDSGRGLLCGLTTQDIYTNTGNCVVGQTYFFYVEYENGVLTLGISEDGENYTIVVAKDQVLKQCVSTSENIYLGVLADHKESLYMRGYIDLKQFSITVDGKEVFTGAKEKFYAIGDF